MAGQILAEILSSDDDDDAEDNLRDDELLLAVAAGHRQKVVRIQNFSEVTAPQYSASEFRDNFRMLREVFMAVLE